MDTDGKNSRIPREALDSFSKLGFKLPSKPSLECDDLPNDLDHRSDQELIMFMSKYGAWADYADGQVALVENELSSVSSARDFLFDRELLVVSPSEYRQITERKAAVNAKPDIEKLTITILEKEALAKLLRTMAKINERRQSIVSRELSRRLGPQKGGFTK